MKGEELKILFKEDMAFLTKEVALDFKQVQISESPVKFKEPSFWTIRVINYIESERKLFVEVLDYQVGETEFSYNQIQHADLLVEIEKVTFKSIDTSGLLMTLNGPRPMRYLPRKQETVYRREPVITPEASNKREPIKQSYTEPFSIPIKNILFINGGVTFEKKIIPFNEIVKFEIPNETIIEEYDAIKNYFASVLKTKKIQVVPTIIKVDGVITSVNATSSEIEKIDKILIEEVKFELVNNARRKEETSDKQLFTMSEYLEGFADESIGAQHLFKDDDDFFENLIEKSGTKHHRHLRFLSSKHKSDLLKLRFAHKPFSFVFLLRGISNFHIIWETLDTEEATYIWTFHNELKDLRQILIQIDKTISLIVRDGKNEYLSRNEENFYRVFHDYTDSQNGFNNWKEEIEKIILQ